MRARIKEQWRAAPEGHTTIVYLPGAIVEGKLAEWAVHCGVAERIDVELEAKVTPPVEVKKRRGRPPKNKVQS